MLMALDVPAPTSIHVTVETAESDAVIWSCDCSTLVPLSIVFLTSVATVSGLTGLVRVSPTVLNVANSN